MLTKNNSWRSMDGLFMAKNHGKPRNIVSCQSWVRTMVNQPWLMMIEVNDDGWYMEQWLWMMVFDSDYPIYVWLIMVGYVLKLVNDCKGDPWQQAIPSKPQWIAIDGTSNIWWFLKPWGAPQLSSKSLAIYGNQLSAGLRDLPPLLSFYSALLWNDAVEVTKQ